VLFGHIRNLELDRLNKVTINSINLLALLIQSAHDPILGGNYTDKHTLKHLVGPGQEENREFGKTNSGLVFQSFCICNGEGFKTLHL
jgi:hypothetical protein